MKFFKNYPRISGLLIGFALGLTIAVGNSHYANVAISEYKSIVKQREAKYEELLSKSHTEIESLHKMNEKLSQQIKKRKIIKPDGTVIEDTDINTDSNTVSETSIRQTVEIEYEKKLSEQKEKYTETINDLKSRKLRVGIGYNSDLEYYGHGSYNIWGPISLGGGATSSGTFMIDLGVSL